MLRNLDQVVFSAIPGRSNLFFDRVAIFSDKIYEN